jgi:3-hydroxy acid dehydrogenase/malonic semialdehyde reductase
MKHITMITGATAGIGEACAELFASHGHDLILTGRRADRLAALAERLRAQHGVQVQALAFDVRDRAAVDAAWRQLPPAWQAVEVLVNNAGLAAGRSAVQDGDIDDWDAMIDTNVKGLLHVTRQVLPQMVAARRGHVINIGSIAGRDVYPGGAVYCASKFAVEGLSRALRLDVVQHNVKVTTISPGLVETEFSLVRFKGDQEKADAVYQGIDPLTGKDIADMVWFAASQPAHICINDIHITCTAQADTKTVVRQPS